MSGGCSTIAVYGTLRPGGGALERLGVVDRMTRIGPCVLNGHLYDFGAYPGFVEGEGRVIGDLFEMPDAEVLAILDRWERYWEHDLASSFYLRRQVRLIEPAQAAWTYLYNQSVEAVPRVPGGDWLAYVGARV